jgi:hypothetical protein
VATLHLKQSLGVIRQLYYEEKKRIFTILKKEYSIQKRPKNEFHTKEIATVAYNMKGYLRFSIFIFWVSTNLAKYTYEWSALEQHYKIEKKTLGLKCLPRKNPIYKNQGWDPIHQKYKANGSE